MIKWNELKVSPKVLVLVVGILGLIAGVIPTIGILSGSWILGILFVAIGLGLGWIVFGISQVSGGFLQKKSRRTGAKSKVQIEAQDAVTEIVSNEDIAQ